MNLMMMPYSLSEFSLHKIYSWKFTNLLFSIVVTKIVQKLFKLVSPLGGGCQGARFKLMIFILLVRSCYISLVFNYKLDPVSLREISLVCHLF